MKDPRLDLDRISMLPGSIIETILTLIPVRDAVRTSVLSTKWKYKWANIPNLVFDHNLFQGSVISNELSTRHTIICAIHQVLLLHHGPILEFTLDMSGVQKNFGIEQIILHLSRNYTLRKFTLNAYNNYKLPSLFYSLQQLTHLNLMNCELHLPSTFNGFNMLTSIYLDCISITSEMLLRLVSGCPLLKSFTLLKVDAALDERDEFSFLQTFEFLPMIEHLHLTFRNFQFKGYDVDEMPIKRSTSLVHLKDLELVTLSQACDGYFTFALVLIKSSPNLEKIKIKGPKTLSRNSTVFFKLRDNLDVLDHLLEFEIKDFNCHTSEWEFLCPFLCKSPMLKKMRTKLNYKVKSDKEIRLLRALLRIQRTMPRIEFIVER